MGETIIRVKIKAKGGVLIRIRTIKGMEGGTTVIRTENNIAFSNSYLVEDLY